MLSILSMTYGRPSMTSNIPKVPLPRPLEDSQLSFQSDQTGSTTSNLSRMRFFCESVRVYEILDEILSNVYWSGPLSSTSTGMKDLPADSVILLDAKLRNFEAEVPPFLSWKMSDSSASVLSELSPDLQELYQRQRNILHARKVYRKLLFYTSSDRTQVSLHTDNVIPPDANPIVQSE